MLAKTGKFQPWERAAPAAVTSVCFGLAARSRSVRTASDETSRLLRTICRKKGRKEIIRSPLAARKAALWPPHRWRSASLPVLSMRTERGCLVIGLAKRVCNVKQRQFLIQTTLLAAYTYAYYVVCLYRELFWLASNTSYTSLWCGVAALDPSTEWNQKRTRSS
jgi:hypothetical protein